MSQVATCLATQQFFEAVPCAQGFEEIDSIEEPSNLTLEAICMHVAHVDEPLGAVSVHGHCPRLGLVNFAGDGLIIRTMKRTLAASATSPVPEKSNSQAVRWRIAMVD